MSHLDKSSIQKLTQLCRIDCTEEEQEALLKDLEKILTYFDQLQEINTENTAPCNHVISEIQNVMREDEVGETLPRELLLSNSPDHIDGMIKVPPVINKSSAQEG